ncbi:MAG: hypothetical protein PVF75_03745 [Granulosicoccaceae bacterium]
MKPVTIIAAGCLLLGAAHNIAAENAYLIYEEIDFNTDGWISKQEASKRPDLLANWERIDTNSDGLIGPMEYLHYEGGNSYAPPDDRQDMDPGAAPL